MKAPAKVAPGRYRLRVEGPRAAGEQDAIRAEAVKAVWDAYHEPGKDEAALRRKVASFERALPLWHRLGEPRREAETLYLPR